MNFFRRGSALRGLMLAATLSTTLLAAPGDSLASGSSDTLVEWTGRIDSIPMGGLYGGYVVGGRAVTVTTTTEIETEGGPVALGATALVRSFDNGAGGSEAKKLKIVSSSSSSGSGSSGSGSSGSGSSGSGSSNSSSQPRVDLTELLGTVESGPNGTAIGLWRIAGRNVTVTASTLIKTELGLLAPGAFVEVKGVAQSDGSLIATKVEVQLASNPNLPPASGPAQITGAIQSLPADVRNGDWSVAGVTVRVTAKTFLNLERGFPAPGSVVEVKGTLLASGAIEAAVIELKTGAGVTPTARFVSSSGVLRSRTRGESSEWLVDDSKLRVSASTLVDDSSSLAVAGVEVEFSGWDTKDSIQAVSVRVKAPAASSQPNARLARVEGAIAADFTPSQFTLGGTRIIVHSSTKIELLGGPLAAGVWAQAKGVLQDDGSLLATKLETKPAPGLPQLEDRVLGAIETRPDDSMSGEWKIGGRRVRISGDTRFLTAAGDAATGAVVQVRGWKLSDDRIDAVEVEVHSPRR